MASPVLHGPTGATEEERFLRMVGRSPDCWRWLGGVKANGYGMFAIKRDNRWTKANAHRYAYELFVGPIPDEWEVDHLCRVRSCVNPDHLEVVTLRENRRRRQERLANSHTHRSGGAGTDQWGHPRSLCLDCGQLLPKT